MFSQIFVFLDEFLHFYRANEMRKDAKIFAKKGKFLQNIREKIFHFRWKPYFRIKERMEKLMHSNILQ